MPAIYQLANGRAGEGLGDDGLAASAQIGKGYFSKAKSFPILKQRRGVIFLKNLIRGTFHGLCVLWEICSTKYVFVTLSKLPGFICSVNLRKTTMATFITVEKIHAKFKIKTDKKSVINCQLSAHLTLKTGTYKIITILPNIPILKEKYSWKD